MIRNIYNHSCSRCKLSSLRQPSEIVCVPGYGDWNSKAMILGEAPGANEAISGEPFIGRAGKVLDRALELSGITRDEVFITNTVKCRPPKNRNPEESEEEACRFYLDKEIQIIKPVIIMALGNHALRAITGKTGITQIAGRMLDSIVFEEVKVVPNYHPAYILYQPSLRGQFETIVCNFVECWRQIQPVS